MGFGTSQARAAQQADKENVRRAVEQIENDEPASQPGASAPAPAASASRPSAASFFMKSGSPGASPRPSPEPQASAAPAPGRPTAFAAGKPQPAAGGRPRAFGVPAPAQSAAAPAQSGGFRAPQAGASQSPSANVPMPAPRSLQQLRLDRLIEEVAKVRGVKAVALQEMIEKANAQPEAARVAFEKAYREEVLPLRENMVRDMASARSQNPDAVVFMLSDPQNKKSRVIVLDQADAKSKGLSLLDNSTLVCQTSDYTPFDRPAVVFGEGRGLSDDPTQQETRRAPRP